MGPLESSGLITPLKHQLQEITQFNQSHAAIGIDQEEVGSIIKKINGLNKKINELHAKFGTPETLSLKDKFWQLIGYPTDKENLSQELDQLKQKLHQEIAQFTTQLLQNPLRLDTEEQLSRIRKARNLCTMEAGLTESNPLVAHNIELYRDLEMQLADNLLAQGEIDQALQLYTELNQENPTDTLQLKIEMLRKFSDDLKLIGAICQKHTSQYPQLAKNIMTLCHHACMEMITNTHPDQRPSLIHIDRGHHLKQTKEFIGKIIYLADNHPDKFSETWRKEALTWPKNVEKATQEEIATFNTSISHMVNWIEDSFVHHVELAAGTISQTWIAHSKGSIQDTDLAVGQTIPIVFAKLLVTSEGTVNANIIDLTERYLIHPKHEHLPYEKDIAYVLDTFKTQPQLQKILSGIRKPASDKLPSNELIRTTLGLPFNQPLTDHDAQVVALSALLSHWRQKSIGSCFVSSFAIKHLHDALEQSLEDFSLLLHEGSIKRVTADKTIKIFPFSLEMSDETLSKEIRFNRKGFLVNKDGKVLQKIKDIPGIKAACQGMGIKESRLEELILQIIRDMPLNKNSLTAKKMIAKLATVGLTHLSDAKLRARIKIGCYRYEAENQTPLLRAWENALGSSAEYQNAMANETAHSISNLLSKKFPDLPENLKNNLHQEFLARTIYTFSSELLLSEDDTDTYESGFVICDNRHQDNPESWKKVDHPLTFQNYMADLLQSAAQKTQADMSKNEKQTIKTLVKNITDYMHTKEFLNSLIQSYHEDNAEISNPIDKWKEIKQLPWRSIQWGYAENVYNITNPANAPITILKTKTNIYNQAINIIEFSKNYIQLQKKGSQPIKIPLIAETHSFLFLPTHPTMKRGKKKNLSDSMWLKKTCIKPGKAISDLPMQVEWKNKLHNYIKVKILDEKNRISFDEQTSTLPQHLTIQQHRDAIINLLTTIGCSYIDVKTRIIDTFLNNNILPDDLQKKLRDSAIHFADSNWETSVHDVHFCYMVNIGSGKMEFVAMNEDGTDIQIQNQEEWQRDFTFFVNP